MLTYLSNLLQNFSDFFIISLIVVLKKSPDLLRGYIINHFLECDYLRWAIKVFLVCFLSLYEHIFETLLFVLFVTCLFYYTCYFMQACGMKLLRTRDNPDYKVMSWFNNKLNHVWLVITFSRMLQASIYLHMHNTYMHLYNFIYTCMQFIIIAQYIHGSLLYISSFMLVCYFHQNLSFYDMLVYDYEHYILVFMYG